jgi:hypothetical protein
MDDEDEAEYMRSLISPEKEIIKHYEHQIKNLFPYHSPRLFLWGYNLVFVVTSLTLTTSILFLIPYADFYPIHPLAQVKH